MNTYRLIVPISFCCLVACTTMQKPVEMPLTTQNPITPPTEPGVPVKTSSSHNQASNISSWDLSGAIAARNKTKSWTASINWQQQGPNRYQIRLLGPLGGGTIVVEKQGNVVTYRDGPKKIASSDADKLLFAQTGVRLPVNSLYYWVRGIPAPGNVNSEKHATGGATSELHQDGYTITYLQYTLVNNTPLPTKIRLEGRGVMIKLVIKHWKI